MDAAVSQRKFDREVERMRTFAADFVQAAGWEIVGSTYPVLAVVFTHPRTKRRMGFRFQCDGWDEQPPSLSLFDPETHVELPGDKWPTGGWSMGNPHPTTGKPFLCLRGIREYHIHSSHLNDSWPDHKGKSSYGLLSLVQRVQQRFGDTNG